jgi:hypothetical protein
MNGSKYFGQFGRIKTRHPTLGKLKTRKPKPRHEAYIKRIIAFGTVWVLSCLNRKERMEFEEEIIVAVNEAQFNKLVENHVRTLCFKSVFARLHDDQSCEGQACDH